MSRFLNHLSVKQKLWLGALLILLVLFTMAAQVMRNQSHAQHSLHSVFQEHLPALEAAHSLKGRMKDATTALGFYLLGKDPAEKAQYQASLKSLREPLNILLGLSSIQTQAASHSLLKDINEDINSLIDMQAEFLQVADSQAANMPALAWAQNEFQPLYQQTLDNLELLLFEEERHSGKLDHDLLHYLLRMQQHWLSVSRGMLAYLAFHDEAYPDYITTHHDAFWKTIAELQARTNLLSPHQRDTLEAILQVKDHSTKTIVGFIKLHRAPDWRRDAYLVQWRIGPVISHLTMELDQLIALQTAVIQDANTAHMQDMEKSNDLLLALGVELIMLSLLVLTLLNRVVIRPLRSAEQAMGNIAEQGDLRQRLEVESQDEFGHLAHSFNSFVERIKNVVEMVLSSSHNLVTEAGRLGSITSNTHQRVSQQAQQIQAMGHSFEELNQALTQISHHMDEASSAAQQATNQANDGRKVMDRTVAAIEEVASETDDINSAIGELDQLSEGIGGIVGIISGFTDQTNLLALNAAIEAARAGEAGRGFAVVADEVRALSNKIHEQTDAIRTRINELQTSVKATVQRMENGRDQAHATAALAGEAGTALSGIIATIGTITDMNARVAAATERHQTQAVAINTSLAQIQGIAEEAAQASAEASNSGNEFSIMAQQLEDLVSGYLLKHQHTEIPQLARMQTRSATKTAEEKSSPPADDNITLF